MSDVLEENGIRLLRDSEVVAGVPYHRIDRLQLGKKKDGTRWERWVCRSWYRDWTLAEETFHRMVAVKGKER